VGSGAKPQPPTILVRIQGEGTLLVHGIQDARFETSAFLIL